MTADNDNIDPIKDDVFIEQTGLLYDGLKVATIANLVSSLFLIAIMSDILDSTHIVIWLFITFSVGFLRALLAKEYKNIDLEINNVKKWNQYFFYGVLASGISWGYAGFFFFPVDKVEYQAFLTFVLAGMCTGAIGTLASQTRNVFAFLLPTLLPLAFNFILLNNKMSWAMASMIILFLVLSYMNARRISHDTQQNIILRINAIRSQVALEKSGETIDNLVQSSPMGIFIYQLDSDGKLIFSGYNPAADRILGADCKKFMGMTLEEAFPPLANTEVPYRYRRAAALGETWINEELSYNDNHITGAFEVYAFQISKNRVAVMFFDITNRKRAEKDLMSSYERLKHVLSSTSTVMYSLCKKDDQFAPDWVSDNIEAVTGYTIEEVLSENWWFNNLHPDDQATAIGAMATLEANKQLQHEYRFRLKSGEYVWILDQLIVTNIAENANSIQIIGAWTNISDQKHNEEALNTAKNEAEKANKAKSEFLSRMSHELRTPMNAVLGFSQLLKIDKKAPLNSSQVGYVNEIINGGEHLLNLINEVLDLSRIESGNMKLSIDNVDPTSLINECIQLVQSLASEHNVSIQIENQLYNTVVRADYTRLKQIILNLLSNAIKYNKKGGTVDVTTSLLDEGLLRINILDTGIGISKEKQQHLFQSFNRLGFENSEIDGTGIGLVISQKLASLMNGILSFTSEEGQGSSFWTDIPLSDNTEIATEENRHVTDSNQQLSAFTEQDSLVVLYIEDNPANLKLVEDILKRLTNIKLISASDPFSGLDKAKKEFPNLVLLDINLPGLTGYEVLQRLRNDPETNAIPAIAVSANATESDIRKGLNAGFKEYITKPIDIEALTRAINTHIKSD